MWLIIAVLLAIVGILVLLYKLRRDSKELDTAMQPIEHSKSLSFEEIDQTIFLKT